MNKALFIKLLVCMTAFAFYLYSVLDMQNQINHVSYQIPIIEKELKEFEEENVKVAFDISKKQSPENLLKLVRDNAYSHLKHPTGDVKINLVEGIALQPMQKKPTILKPGIKALDRIEIARR